ncbi:hypothetical protein BUALT_Bualt03G0134200 [Buddleja alternifolia]|uniref:Uncharacterized protein n=1 Tax=Buddleja alternifolia TaxID=168488 RepID=A0AAV6Y4Q5_9LAMI|nr:hypothetical protein BUALT_Bualt03G0134200 [Buddleja alternifolia]
MESSIYNVVKSAFVKELSHVSRVKAVASFEVCYSSKILPKTQVGPSALFVDFVMHHKDVFWRIYGGNSLVGVNNGEVLCMGFIDVNMARICRKKMQIFLILQEIIVQSLFFFNLVIALLQDERFGNRRRAERVVRYVMANRIPDQVSHMRRIVEYSDTSCANNLRMNRNAFGRLCYLLEHVALLKLYPLILVTPEPVEEDSTDSRWKWFKGCLGALDGSYINVRVRDTEKARYRNRKGEVSSNLLRVVVRFCKFVYILPGWERSAADARVLRDAINRPHRFKVPSGKYYLCDNGYTNCEGFLTPYRGARNVIERTWGMLKMRWAMLRSHAFYPIKTQNHIVMACCLLHNFIRMEMPIDPLDHLFPDLYVNNADADDNMEFIDTVESSTEWSNWRDSVANAIYKQMESSSTQISKGNGPMKTCDQSRRSWTRPEEEVLLTALKEIVAAGWKSDNGFRTGYLHELEQAMIKTFPGTNLRAQPHINSKIHTWKKQYGSLFMMMDKSGVGWNETTGMLETTDEAWERVIRNDPSARLMRYKSWPFYREWCEVFGKDRATGEGAEDIAEAVGGLMNDENQEEDLVGKEANQQENAGETETTSVNENAGSSSSKKIGKRKRNVVDYQDTVVDFLGAFVENSKDRLGDIARNLSLEYDISLKQREVFKIVENMEGLNEEEKLIASQMLVKNSDDLMLFFSLPAERKIKYVRMKLDGRL